MKFKKLFYFLGIIFSFFLKVDFVSALERTYPTILGKSLNDSSTIADFICYLYSTGVALAASLTVVIIAYGSVYYLISYGRGKFTSEAKDIIKSGILGLLIILCSALIMYTINPAIENCQIAFLPQLNLLDISPYSNTPISPDITIATYHEIPLGTLTENLLTRVEPCENYDQNGDPIGFDRDPVGGGVSPSNNGIGNVDRVSCYRELVEGAQKKAELISKVSDKISQLMDSCHCDASKCRPPVCTPFGNATAVGSPGAYSADTSDCSCTGGGACTQLPSKNDCCPTGIKNQIEHGGVVVDQGCNPCSSNADCTLSGQTCNLSTHTCQKSFKGLDEFRCDENSPNASDENSPDGKCTYEKITKFILTSAGTEGVQGVSSIDPTKWSSLTLWQQLTWFRGYIHAFKDAYGFQADLDNLTSAKSSMASCRNIIPYVDVLQTNTISDKNNLINIKKQSDLTDFQTGAKIDSSKYCAGFNYANSNCFEQCNNFCPDDSSAAINIYKGGSTTNFVNTYKNRPCPNSGGGSGDNQAPTYSTFGDCITGCQNNCQTYCGQEYSSCSPEYNFCVSQCQNDGKCVLDNADKCLFGAQDFIDCAKNNPATDQGNIKYCINNAYLCKNGSDENSGSADCLNSTASSCASNTTKKACINNTNCAWDGEECLKNHTASFLYQNPSQQKCSDPYAVAGSGSVCKSTADPNALCQDVCPETAKCPTSSDCPQCPCDFINNTLKFSIPNTSTAVWKTVGCTDNAGCPTGQTCVDNVCEKSCSGNSDCFPDQACVPDCPVKPCSSNVCIIGGGSCTDDTDCPACSNNICMSNGKRDTPCARNTDCEEYNTDPKLEHETCSIPSGATVGVCITNAGNEGSHVDQTPLSIYQMVGAQCNSYSYNDDPLTFYCEDNWWNDPQKDEAINGEPIGNERTCYREDDIPIGQTVDNAIKWARDFIASGGIIDTDIAKILDQMKKMGDAINTPPVQEYCKCDAQLENANPICESSCLVDPNGTLITAEIPAVAGTDGVPAGCDPTCTATTTTVSSGCTPCTGTVTTRTPSNCDPYCLPSWIGCIHCSTITSNTPAECSTSCTSSTTDVTTYSPAGCTICTTNPVAGTPDIPPTYACACTPVPCKGSPCQQIIDYHSELWNDYKQFKTDFMGFDIEIVKDPRSDIIKSLVYSRQTTDSCSLINNEYGSDARLLSCSKVMNELVPPTNSTTLNYKGGNYDGYCYGRYLGEYKDGTNEDLTDDWFCCQQQTNSPNLNNNPIYNIHNNNF